MIKIKFLGAAGTVTGSKFLLQLDNYKILIDCGLFQGLKYLRNLNWEALPIEVKQINAVLITHAHLDHTGYLPLLVRSGYSGEIYMTAPTAQLSAIVLKDSAKIQEEDAERANRFSYSRHNPALPLYTIKNADECIKKFKVCDADQWIKLSDDLKIIFKKNGHILGSCFIQIDYKGKKFIFSGDLGRKESYTLDAPIVPDKADVLVLESTYGNKIHSTISAEDQLAEVVHDTVRKKGNIIISSFAIGRAQELMVILQKLKKANKIPNVPVYMDSPMSSEATKVLFSNPDWHKLSFEECERISKDIFFVRTFEDTQSVIELPGPKIIIAASGMLAGGRILEYLKRYIGHDENTVLLVGYQAEGTRGKTLKEGGHELKIHGSYYKVKAEVRELTTLSAHGDQLELLDWVKNLQKKPSQVFLVHGESDALHTLQGKLKAELGIDAVIPTLNDEFEIL